MEMESESESRSITFLASPTMEDGEKSRAVFGDPQSQYYYGTFQGVANYYPPAQQPPPQPVVGFPQPQVPQGVSFRPCYHGYQTIPGYAVVEGRPLIAARLPCCGFGVGWFLFMIGFFLGGIPWYFGAFILLLVPVDYREKPGYVACMIASILAVIAVTLHLTKGDHEWWI